MKRETLFWKAVIVLMALQNIERCALAITGLYVLCLPIILYVAVDDAPGLGLVITFGALVIAVFTAVLQKLLQNAIELKSENDLTV